MIRKAMIHRNGNENKINLKKKLLWFVRVQCLLRICIVSVLLVALVCMSASSYTLLLPKIGWAYTNYSSRRVLREVTCPVTSVNKGFTSCCTFDYTSLDKRVVLVTPVSLKGTTLN